MRCDFHVPLDANALPLLLRLEIEIAAHELHQTWLLGLSGAGSTNSARRVRYRGSRLQQSYCSKMRKATGPRSNSCYGRDCALIGAGVHSE